MTNASNGATDSHSNTGTDKTESPASRLARYLKEFVGLRSKTICEVTNYESVLWFGDMPQEADCVSGAWADDYNPEAPWLEVRKQHFRSPPEPPSVTAGWVDKNALRKATPQIPPLAATIFVEDPEAELADDEAPPLVEHHLSAHPDVADAYEAFRPAWEAWSSDYLRRDGVQRVYAELFRLHNQLQKRGEVIEVVLGLGLVDWRANIGDRSIPLRRHAVVGQVDLAFDPEKGVICVGPPGDGARLRIEDDMLEAELRPDRSHYSAVEAQLDEVGDAIWDESLMHSALKTWSGALSPDSTWFEGLGAQPSTGKDPVVSFAPALILRTRLQTGMVRIYERLIEQLASGEREVPAGWGRLIDDDWGDGAGACSAPPESEPERSATPAPTLETYFPLPANHEQRRIVDALEHNQGVLVQGPPGTGKSHTIANLMCHLLATGKRVLITAETARALRVLKDKLPDEIRPLCVSLLGQGGDAFAELNTAVQGITTRHSSYSPGAYDDRIAEIDQELDAARRNLAELDSEIRSLREDETCPHSLLDGEYQGTASKIAERVAGERDRFGWLVLSREKGDHPLVSNAEASRWLEIRRQYSPDEIEVSTRPIPDSASVPSPEAFLEFVADEDDARSNSEGVHALRAHRVFGEISALSTDERNRLREQLQSIEALRLDLQRQQAAWLPTALREVVVGHDPKWQTLQDLSRV
ncbi:MAG TPA: AAA domain-containing protein, partial [Thermoleophilia bacterium]|nr:AAA domain-containing protein [Thermoleophilia bacterium]